MGTPVYAAAILHDLIDSNQCEIPLVITQPDRPVGRKQILTPPPVKEVASAAGLPIWQPERLESCADKLSSLCPDLIVVAAYGQILSKCILDIAPCINLHASLLPVYRGAAPVQAALLSGDWQTGMTLMAMEAGLDTGPMIAFAPVNTAGHDTASLTSVLQKSGAPLLIEAIMRYERLKPIAQHGCDATLVKKVKKTDGQMSFGATAWQLERAFRAYAPWPGLFLSNGLAILDLRVGQTGVSEDAGTILSVWQGAIEVATLAGSVWIERVQAPSKKSTAASDYLNGKRLGVGDLLV